MSHDVLKDVIVSVQTGIVSLDCRNLTSLPSNLLSKRHSVHGVNTDDTQYQKNKITSVSFDDESTNNWWQVEPVTKISLSRNNIEHIPDEIVEECYETLVHLDFSYNRIQSLPSTLIHCNNLKYLNVSHNKLHSLAKVPSSVVVLDISSNGISTLPDSFGCCGEKNNVRFSDKPKLVEFRANDNTICELSRAFINFSFLQVVELRNNKLTSSSLNFLLKCKDLKEVNLSQNAITYLPDLKYLCNLKRLDVRENKISDIPASLSNLTSLCELYVGMNCIKHLNEDIEWCQLKSLTVFDINTNSLTHLDEEISEIPNLSIIDISNNDIKNLPFSLGKMKCLRKVILHGNPIRSIRRELLEEETTVLLKYLSEKLEKSQVFGDKQEVGEHKADAHERFSIVPQNGRLMHIDDKTLENMPVIDGHVESITHLELRNNNLDFSEEDCSKLCSLKNIVEIDFSKNKITKWPFRDLPGEMFPKSNLYYLNMAYNCFDICPSTTKSLSLHFHFPNIVVLDLSGMNLSLEIVDNDISRLSDLQELILQQCGLSSFPSSILKLNSLQRLNVNGNHIDTLPEKISDLQVLRSLDIGNNDITQLPYTLGLMDAHLNNLQLEGNPLRSIRRISVKGTKALLEYLRNKL